jgi:hypothetical protein
MRGAGKVDVPSQDSLDRRSSMWTSTPTVQPQPKRKLLVDPPYQRLPSRICTDREGGRGRGRGSMSFPPERSMDGHRWYMNLAS